jgi:hypothetical protein
MLTFEIDRSTGKQLSPYIEEFVGQGVARVVVGENPVACKLHRIAASDRVDQCSALRVAIERQGHPRSHRWRHHAGSYRYEKFKLPGR